MKTSIEQVKGEALANELESILEEYGSRLKAISNEDYYTKVTSTVWSKIETLGSLVDATHNCLQHVMQARLGAKPKTYYSREAWVRCIDYQHYEKDSLISLFFVLNQHLIHVLRGVAPSDFYKACNSASKGTYHRCLKDIVRAHLEQVRFYLGDLCKIENGQRIHLKMLYS